MKCATLMFGVIVGALVTSATLAADFTVGELHTSARDATESFKADYGVPLYDTIYGIQVTKGRESGKVKIFYHQNSDAKTIEYFCHYHNPGQLDCHEH
jgi:hypothetical protein